MVYIDISRFSEPEVMSHHRRWLDLDGLVMKMLQSVIRRRKSLDISEFPSPSVTFKSIFISVQSRLTESVVEFKRLLSAESRNNESFNNV